MMTVANMIVAALAAWFGIGAVIAILFLVFGVNRIDESAKGASVFFRPMIFLGCAMLWPAVVIRWLSGVKINEPDEDAS